jgi:hypothetical protein
VRGKETPNQRTRRGSALPLFSAILGYSVGTLQ